MHKLFSKFIGMRGTLPLKCAENTESEMNQKKLKLSWKRKELSKRNNEHIGEGGPKK